MAKIGIAPPDPSTDVGRFRLLAGDSTPDECDSPAGMGEYAYFSDEEISAFLEATGGNIPRAIAIGYRQISAYWASSGATIRTDDLTYSNKDSVASWLALADKWDKIADDEDKRNGLDYFDLVYPGADVCHRKPEGAPYFRDGGWPW